MGMVASGQLRAMVARMASLANPLSAPANPHPEQQYLVLMRQIWETGSERIDRTGIGTRSVCGSMLRFDLGGGAMPLLTTKRVYWKTATRELLWFLTGETNIRPLVLQGVKIWNEWPHAKYVRETGDPISLDDFVQRIAEDEGFAQRWGDLGPVYGKQWVDWPTYRYRPDGLYEKGLGINQVAAVIESLRTSPGSRRHITDCRSFPCNHGWPSIPVGNGLVQLDWSKNNSSLCEHFGSITKSWNGPQIFFVLTY
jgi:thymidylate synthase